MKLAGISWVGAALLAGCSCAGGNELSVDLRTDFVAGAEFDQVHVELDADPAPPVQARPGDDYANGRRVAEISPVEPGLHRLDVRLTLGGDEVIRRRVNVHVDGSLIVLVVLARDCRGVVCPGSGAAELTECFGGRCVSPDCSGGEDDACGLPECAIDADCGTSTSCVEPACLNGICLELPREGGCAAAEVCVPGTGCIAVVRPDAGMTDGGTECSPATCVAGPCETAACVAGACERSPICADGELCCGGDVCAMDCATSCAGMPAGATCRPSRGDCDLAETCDGSSSTCPPDARQPDGAECRPPAGECDIVDRCAGADDCTPDAFAPVGTPCTGGTCNGLGACLTGCTEGAPCATTNPCERGRIDCSGSMTRCVPAGPAAAGTSCRAATGPCDVEEQCTGSSTDCPADGFAAGTVECRGTAGPCDVAEFCRGSGPDCPSDAMRPSGFECRATSGLCDVAEVCDGSTAACPGNTFRSGTPCRGSAGPCDPEELCSGSSADCPADRLHGAGVPCRGSAGPCDPAEVCSGSTAVCPGDVLEPAGTVCATESGDCEANDVCDGSSPACQERFAPATTICRGASGPCNFADRCTGSSGTCPPDSIAPDGSLCDLRCGEEMCMGGTCVGGRTCTAGQRCGCDEFCVCSTCGCL